MPASRRAAAIVVMAFLLGGCLPSAEAPAAERGLFGGVLAWITGADRASAAARDAEAARAEAAMAHLATRTAASEAEAARTTEALGRALATQD